jgi:carbamate kinase
VYDNFGTAKSKPIREIDVATLKGHRFPSGSMQPKVDAVCDFVSSTNKTASIGALDKLLEILNRRSGTLIK